MKRLIILVTLISLILSIQIGYTAPLTSTLKDQQSVSITIYNSNVGLVKDTRLIDLTKESIIEKTYSSENLPSPLPRSGLIDFSKEG